MDKFTCIIDDKTVSLKEFDLFLKSLKEIPKTWFCRETLYGGETGFDLEDASGQRYEYRALTKSGETVSSISKVLKLP